MLIVECIEDDWNFSDLCVKAISKGAKYPKVGETFVVSGLCSKENGYEGYFLEEIDWSKYNIDICFNIDKFKIIKEDNTINHYDIKHGIGACETFKMTFEVKYNVLENKELKNETFIYTKD